MALIPFIQEGDTGQHVQANILNPVIDIVNNLKGTAGYTGLLSPYIYFEVDGANPNAPDIDIIIKAYYGTLQYSINGTYYGIDLTSSGYGLILDEFDGAANESRIDLIYAIMPPTTPQSGIQIRKGTNAETPVSPSVGVNEVFLGRAYVNQSGISGFDFSGIIEDSGLWQADSIRATLKEPKLISLERFINTSNGTPVATANDVTLNDRGNGFSFTDITNEIQRINQQNASGQTIFTAGSFIFTRLRAVGRMKHMKAASGYLRPLDLADGKDYTAIRETRSIFWLLDSVWKEIGRVASDEIPTVKVEFTLIFNQSEMPKTITPNAIFTGGGNIKWVVNGIEYTKASNSPASIPFAIGDIPEDPTEFIMLLEIPATETISKIELENCNVKSYNNLVALNNTGADFDFKNCLLEGDPLNINEFTEISKFDISGNIFESFICNLQEIEYFTDNQPSISLPNTKFIDLSGSRKLLGTGTSLLNFNAPLLEFINLSKCQSLVDFSAASASLAGDDPVVFNLNTSLLNVDLSNSDINALNTITECPNLQTLNLYNCNILSVDDIPIFSMISLLDVSLRSNFNLTGIFDATNLINATALKINACNFDEIIFDGLINLQRHATSHGYFGNLNCTKYSANGCVNLIGNGNGIMNIGSLSLSYLDLTNCSSILTLEANDNNLGGGVIALSGLTSCLIYQLQNNSLSQGEVDAILAAIDTSGLSSGTLTIISGNTGDPTLSPAYASLIGKSWTIN